MEVIATVGQLKQLVANLPDNMPVENVEGENIIAFVHNFEDIPEDQRPNPTLVIES